MKSQQNTSVSATVIQVDIFKNIGFRIFTFQLIATFLLLLIVNTKAKAQDPAFTQFFYNPLYYNPALAGSNDGIIFRSNYRNFWRKMDNGFNVVDITMDSQEPFLSGGIGLIAMSGIEGNGIIKSQMIGLAYSYNLLLSPRRLELQMGLQGGYVLKSVNTDKLIFSDQLDAIYGVGEYTQYNSGNLNNVSYPDFSTGFNLRSNLGRFYRGKAMSTLNTGFALHHITQPNESFTGLKSSLPMKYVAYTTGIIRIQNIHLKSIYLMPGIIYEQQDNFKTLLAGTNTRIGPVIFGIWYRSNGFDFSTKNIKALSINAGIELGQRAATTIRVNYSYDINISRYQNLLGDAHEVSVSMLLPDYQLFGNGRGYGKGKQFRACYNKF